MPSKNTWSVLFNGILPVLPYKAVLSIFETTFNQKLAGFFPKNHENHENHENEKMFMSPIQVIFCTMQSDKLFTCFLIPYIQ